MRQEQLTSLHPSEVWLQNFKELVTEGDTQMEYSD